MSTEERKTDKGNFSILLQLSSEFKLLLNEDGTPRDPDKMHHLKLNLIKNAYVTLVELVKTPIDRIWRDFAWSICNVKDQGDDVYVGRWKLHSFTKDAFEGIVDDVQGLHKILTDIDENAPKCSWMKLREMSGLI